MSVTTVQFSDQVSDKDFIMNVGVPSSMVGLISLTFYSDSQYKTPVHPTAGTATISVAEDGFNWGDIEHGIITYPLVDDKYNRPNFVGYCGNVKVNLQGITGASHFIIRAHMQR